MKRLFGITFGDCRAHGTLKQCQQLFVKWRDENSLRSSQLKMHDGAVTRAGFSVGHISYNGRFWRTSVRGVRLAPKHKCKR